MFRTILSIGAWFVLSRGAVAETTYVDRTATGSGDGASWANARNDLAVAVSGASAGDEIWVVAGTYGPIALKSGVRIIGGFGGTESATSQSDPVANRTIISGGGTSRAVVSINNDSSAVLRGFSITDGFVDIPGMGGGMYIKDSSPTIVSCVFTRNRCILMGGAVGIFGGVPRFTNCTFHGNDGGCGAGAVWKDLSGAPTFTNCLFYDNRAGEAGAIGLLTGPATFVNCTFTDNHATLKKAGAIFDTRGEAVLHNCILWNNSAVTPGTDEFFNVASAGGKTALTHCLTQGTWPGAGNISADPLFANAPGGDYRLQATSPCRDAGDSSLLPKDLADLDWDGITTTTLAKDLGMDDRISAGSVDVGVYEWTAP